MKEIILKINNETTLEKAVMTIAGLYTEQERFEEAFALFRSVRDYTGYTKEVYELGKIFINAGETGTANSIFDVLVQMDYTDLYTAKAAYEMALLREAQLIEPREGDFTAKMFYREDLIYICVLLEETKGRIPEAREKLKRYRGILEGK